MKTFYIKLTNKCNVACSHCYNSVCDTRQDMSDETIAKILEYLEHSWKALQRGDRIEVALHGGEPTLYDLKKLQDLCGGIIARGATVSATTNLLYEITTEHLKLFNMFVQPDGTKLVVTSWDAGKVRFKNEEMYDLWEDNVKFLLGRGYDVQPIITLTRQALDIPPKDLLDEMRYLGVTHLNFERLTKTGRAEEDKSLWVTNREVDAWLGEAYRLNEIEYKYEIPLFRELELAHEGIKDGCKQRMCMLNVVTINPDGTLACCPNQPLANVGHISRWEYDKRTEEEKAAHAKLIQKECRRPVECMTCEYFPECNGECCQLSWDESGCPGMIETIKNVRKSYEGKLEWE